MSKKKLIGIVAACVIGIIIVIVTAISCEGAPTPTLAKNSIELEEKVQVNMTLDQVYALMTPELNNIVLPAQNIIHQADGKWKFEPKEGGEPGDIDAPYQVLVVYPTSAEQGFYMLFFKDKQLTDDIRFDYETGTKIQKLLWTTEAYGIIINIEPLDGGSVSISPSPSNGEAYQEGTEITLTATPASGYIFGYWSGDASGTSPVHTFTIDISKFITAHFEISD